MLNKRYTNQKKFAIIVNKSIQIDKIIQNNKRILFCIGS